MAKKHLVVEWLSWLACKRDFINSTIIETQKDIPNTLLSLKLLEQKAHELVGEGVHLPPPPPLDNVVGSKSLRSGRVKQLNLVTELSHAGSRIHKISSALSKVIFDGGRGHSNSTFYSLKLCVVINFSLHHCVLCLSFVAVLYSMYT